MIAGMRLFGLIFRNSGLNCSPFEMLIGFTVYGRPISSSATLILRPFGVFQVHNSIGIGASPVRVKRRQDCRDVPAVARRICRHRSAVGRKSAKRAFHDCILLRTLAECALLFRPTQGVTNMAADPNHVILTGENPFIRLSASNGGPQTTNASYWRIITCPAGPGHVLYLK